MYRETDFQNRPVVRMVHVSSGFHVPLITRDGVVYFLVSTTHLWYRENAEPTLSRLQSLTIVEGQKGVPLF